MMYLGYLQVKSISCAISEPGVDNRTTRIESAEWKGDILQTTLLRSANCAASGLEGNFRVKDTLLEIEAWPVFAHDSIIPFMPLRRYGCVCPKRALFEIKGISKEVSSIQFVNAYTGNPMGPTLTIPYQFKFDKSMTRNHGGQNTSTSTVSEIEPPKQLRANLTNSRGDTPIEKRPVVRSMKEVVLPKAR